MAAPPAAAAAAGVVLEPDGAVAPSGLTAGAFLEAGPRGAYTTCRTASGGRSVFMLPSHLRRLAESARLLDEADAARQARAISLHLSTRPGPTHSLGPHPHTPSYRGAAAPWQPRRGSWVWVGVGRASA